MSKKLVNINWSLLIIYIVVGLVAGYLLFILFVLFFYKLLSINNQINFQIDPTNIISLIVTIALALYISRILQRKDEGDKIERNLLMEYFDDFGSQFSEEIHAIIMCEGIKVGDVASF